MLARDFFFCHTVHSTIRRAHKLRAETLRGRVFFGRNTAKREQLRTRTPAVAAVARAKRASLLCSKCSDRHRSRASPSRSLLNLATGLIPTDS